MFGLFKKKSELDKLQEQYERLMSQWHELSTTNRSLSDEKYAQAQQILEKIDALSPQKV